MKSKKKELFIAIFVVLAAAMVWSAKNLLPEFTASKSIQEKTASSYESESSELTLAQIIGVAPGKPVMVDFGSTRCQSCKTMSINMAEAEKILGERAVIIFIDTDTDRELSMKAGITVIPTQIFFDDQGNEAGRNIGVLKTDDIVNFLTGGFPESS